ncbi:MAG TPA: hypothetical protein VNR38_00825 [Ureibacillus sp.]|nr:hypothetical protein [Ureibacillus sp.]
MVTAQSQNRVDIISYDYKPLSYNPVSEKWYSGDEVQKTYLVSLYDDRIVIIDGSKIVLDTYIVNGERKEDDESIIYTYNDEPTGEAIIQVLINKNPVSHKGLLWISSRKNQKGVLITLNEFIRNETRRGL